MSSATRKVRFRNNKALFFNELRKRTRRYFKEHELSKNASSGMISKTVLILSSFVICYVLLVFVAMPWYGTLALSLWMGLILPAIGFNIMHDAAHGSYSKNQTVNTVLAYSLDMIGASATLWKTKHNVIHHTFTNIPEWDADIEQSTLIRMSPSQKLMGVHRFQHIYSFFLYGFLSLMWVFYSDFKKLAQNKIGEYELPEISAKEKAILMMMKVFHIGYALVLPSLFHSFWIVLGIYVLVHFITGVTLAIIFQLAHVHEGVEYPEPEPDTLMIENEWALHQMATTANFATQSKVINWYTGGLNFQIEHHLFPKVCHVHYPQIRKIVMETCREFGVQYKEFPTLWTAIKAHYKQLYQLGRPVVG